MQRRNFLKTISTAAALSVLNPFSSFAQNSLIGLEEDKRIIKPPRLKSGDTIGLIAPGSFIDEGELKESIQNLELLGFKIVYTKNILARDGYLAGTDEQRASDVNEMFSRKDVNGIVAARGGYGCTRILPMLDYNVIKNNPKILVGYSDITALLYGIYKETGLVCFHGPVGISTFNKFSLDYFKDVLIYPHDKLTFYNAHEDNNDDLYKPVTIRGGKAKGKLVGGNLSLVVSVIGTSYDIDTNGKIIFLEEVDEEPYRVDRMITQMIEAGKFDKPAGIALGVFSGCKTKPSQSGVSNSFSVLEVLFDRLFPLNIPVVYGMSYGHITNKFTIPFGINAELDSLEQTLTLLEPAVS
ncbi:MAG: LD-carboxypeptidase [Bacteroidetes bacterium]|nr:LD-carboxypeptidase [Bacteroidota bacterium]